MLDRYDVTPDEQFWKKFPSHRPNKNVVSPRINVKALQKLIQMCWFKWTLPQRLIAKKALKDAKYGAVTKLKGSLPSIRCKNAKSAIENGKHMTDTLAEWVKKKFVAGPYTIPPNGIFRTNQLMAVVQKNKVRPIMNLSAPAGFSFNDAVDTSELSKLSMSSAKAFGKSLKAAGTGARMVKFDIQDAYKLIPGNPSQWGLFGFKWLGKFFFDITRVFGSKAAPEEFDALPETLVNIACTLSNSPKRIVHRQLDDVPAVAPKGSSLVEDFAKKYEEVYKKTGVPLAPFCPNRDKAFPPGESGTLLGIKFNSENMTWSIAKDKGASIREEIGKFATAKACTLKSVQKLHGKISDLAQMLEFGKGFRFNLIAMLGKFQGDKERKKLITKGLRSDLVFWEKCSRAAEAGLPVPEPRETPPLETVRFISDAAGSSGLNPENSTSDDSKNKGKGVASVGYDQKGIWAICLLKWPAGLISGKKNLQGKAFGNKTAMLEAVGLLLPFLSVPWAVRNRHVTLEVDNISLIFA